MGDNPSVLQCILRLEAKHHHGRRIGCTQAGKHIAHGRALDEGRIAEQHHDIAIEPGERFLGLRHRMTGTQLRFLHDRFRTVTKLADYLFTLVADDNDGPRGCQFLDRGHEVFDDRSASNRVESLVQPALETSALAGGQDNGGEFSGLIHAKGPCHQSLAV